MPDYQKLYTLMFNAATDTVASIDRLDSKTAKTILIAAQQEAEELYISQSSDHED